LQRAHQALVTNEKKMVLCLSIKTDVEHGDIVFLLALIKNHITTGKLARWKNASCVTHD
jgi:hypothetical protein